MNEDSATTESLSSIINRVAGILERGGAILNSGDTAAIRRMDPRRPNAAFYKLAVELPMDIARDDQDEGERELRWALIIVGLAQLSELHDSRQDLGTALAEAGFSELRFSRLLRADVETLVDELLMTSRFLAAKNQPANWAQAAWLILSCGRRDEQRARRAIASDYFRERSKRS